MFYLFIFFQFLFFYMSCGTYRLCLFITFKSGSATNNRIVLLIVSLIINNFHFQNRICYIFYALDIKIYFCERLPLLQNDDFQNVSYEAKIENFFILRRSYIPFLRYLSFCIFNHPMIYQISLMSWWVLVHEILHECIF